MTEQTTQKMFIDSLARRYPGRVLSSLQVNYSGFRAFFDLPRKRHLEINLSVYALEGDTLEIYAVARGTQPGRFWLNKSATQKVSGADPLPLLASYLSLVIGSTQQSYEGSFAEVLLTSFR